MYSMKDAVVRNLEFMEENLRLKADVKRFAELNDQLIEENEMLKKKIDKLLVEAVLRQEELIDERDRFDRLSDFELERDKMLQAAKKDAEHAKLMFNIAFSYLDQTGYDVEKLGHIVALRCALEESGLV